MEEQKVQLSESGHWYDYEGNAQYTIVKTVKKEILHYEMQESYFMYHQLQVS